MNFKINAIVTERLFIVAILLLSTLIVVDFVYVSKILRQKSVAADHAKISAEISSDDLTTVKEGAAYIKSIPETVKRSEAITAQSALYRYQNQIVTDINNYARQAGISVSSYTFPPETTAATPPTPTTTAPAAGKPATTVPTGIKSSAVTITFGSKVGYSQFLHFLKLVENNITRMQITDVTLTPDADPSQLASPSLSLKVYTR